MSVSASVIPASLVGGGRFVRFRQIEKPPQHGEKPYAKLVADAFNGPVLRLSQKLRLLEEADNRHIRRGDALDVIASTQRRLEKQFSVRRRKPMELFATRYAAFAAAYLALAIAWCAIFGLH